MASILLFNAKDKTVDSPKPFFFLHRNDSGKENGNVSPNFLIEAAT